MINFSPALSALQAFGTGMQGTAYNVANVNTDKFQPVAVNYQSGSPADQGVRALVSRPEPVAQETDAPTQASPEALQSAYWARLPQSNTELSREFTNMILDERSFEANTVSIRTGDEMLGAVLDMKI